MYRIKKKKYFAAVNDPAVGEGMIVFPFVKGTGAGCEEQRVTRGTATSQNTSDNEFPASSIKM